MKVIQGSAAKGESKKFHAFSPQHWRKAIGLNIVQPKLTIGAPNDIYEKEADRLADRVMRMSSGGYPAISEGVTVQSKPLQGEINRLIQRASLDDEEEPLSRSASTSGIPEVTPRIESNINSLKSGGQPLSSDTRSFFEPRFGVDFSNVRVHTGARAKQTASSIQAKAFTTGSNIVFNTGQYSPTTTAGRTLLAHELTHVLQQGGEQTNGKLSLSTDKTSVYNSVKHATKRAPSNYLHPFRLSSSNRVSYPKLAEYVRNRVPDLAEHRTIVNALTGFANIVQDDIRRHFEYGQGPLIVVEQLGNKYGSFMPYINSNKFKIDVDLVNNLETATGSDVLPYLLLVGATILHEYTHYIDDLDGIDNPVEEGDALETQVYGRVINNTNDARQVWQEYYRRRRDR